MPHKALVVDDSAMDRRLAQRLLQRQTDLEILTACDGEEALAALEEHDIRLVVTDLMMPRLSGLDLVRRARREYPRVPVILMTAHGSEETAAEALREGAASYVPKQNLPSDLPLTVERVLAAAAEDQLKRVLWGCLTRWECCFVLGNDPDLVRPCVRYLQECLIPLGLCGEGARTRVGIAIEEALINALYHGNLGIGSEVREQGLEVYTTLAEERREQAPYRDRCIHVTATATRSEATYVIRDEGDGFDPSVLPDPTDPSNLELPGGRGLLLIRTFMDEVRYNETGNEITMIKWRPEEIPDGAD